MDASVSTADLYDDFGVRCASCAMQFKQYGGKHEFCGRIRTVRCLGDNILLRKSFETAVHGDVLVVDGAGYLGSALMGDRIASIGLANGWSGIIIHGAVRDASALRKLPFGVKAMGTNPQRSAQDGAGEVDVVLSFGGITFTPGHWLYSDDDGILVSAERLEVSDRRVEQGVAVRVGAEVK